MRASGYWSPSKQPASPSAEPPTKCSSPARFRDVRPERPVRVGRGPDIPQPAQARAPPLGALGRQRRVHERLGPELALEASRSSARGRSSFRNEPVAAVLAQEDL